MTNRTLTSLILRIAGIYLFTNLFKLFGAYFLSIYSIAIMTELNEPLNKFYFSLTFLAIANITISSILFLKADWISKKLIKTDSEIVTELNPKSLTKVILLTVSVIWLVEIIYLIPDFIDYCIKLTSKLNGNEEVKIPDFELVYYILKVVLTLIIIFKIENISSWIVKKI